MFENACPQFGISAPRKNLGSKSTHFGRFSMTSQLNGEYIPNKTRYRPSENGDFRSGKLLSRRRKVGSDGAETFSGNSFQI